MSNDPVLLVIDAQKGFRDTEHWGSGANPECLSNIELLVAAWRAKNFPVIIVKHNSKNPDSPLFSGNPGNQLEDFLDGAREALIQKSINSAFYGTPDLMLFMHKRNFKKLVICGITTNFCCETTARMAGNLGFETTFVIDATDAFDQKDLNGDVIAGVDVMRMTAANLNGEFAEVLLTKDLLATLA
ncbi:MAG: isochorismatase family protein [Aquiluna sp.]|nr:isochorismatase family protein [Aquiluna sp.]MCF8544983.1 isochorismatase family protein [Aquiluna sp.]